MMRVLSVLHFPVFGGPHNRNARIGSLLKKENVETILLLPDDAFQAAARVEAAGTETICIPLARLRKTLRPGEHLKLLQSYGQNIKDIRSVIRERSIDVVVVNGLMNPHAAIAAKREKVAVVWQILDTAPPPMVRRFMRPILTRYADVIMCTGTKVAEDHLGTDKPRQPVVLFNPPVDIHRFTPAMTIRTAMRQELGFGDENLVIGNVANVNPMKGHGTFIRAAAKVKSRYAHAVFVIFGQTYTNHAEYVRQLTTEAKALGLELGKDLKIVNPDERVAELAQALDIYWHTSEPRSEGISTAVEEAMALGLPVISTETGSMAEIVRHGVSGFMVAPYDTDAICQHTIELAENNGLRQGFGAAARQFAFEHFATDRCALAHFSAYRAALGDVDALADVSTWP